MWASVHRGDCVVPITRGPESVIESTLGVSAKVNPRAKQFETDVRLLYVRIEKGFQVVVKSFQDKSLKDANERRQPFCC